MWNYRIISKAYEGSTYYALSEVYYNSDASEAPGTYSYTSPSLGWFDDPQELIDCLALMLNDATKDRPILDTDWDASWAWEASVSWPASPINGAPIE